jgi:intracellular septation protein
MTDAHGTPLPPPQHAGLKLIIELAPLLAFFLVLLKFGLYAATGTLMGATLVSVISSRLILGNVSTPALVSLVLVWVFGVLTFVFDDTSFIKIKPTIINLLFAAVLAGGLYAGRLFIKMLLGDALRLTDLGWRKLTVRWIAFFLFLAVANEVVWRSASDATWGAFKFAILPMTLIFAAAQIGLIKAHSDDADADHNP